MPRHNSHPIHAALFPAGFHVRRVTDERVIAACEQLGSQVSVRNVRELLGGSLRDIAPRVKAWRRWRAEQAPSGDAIPPITAADRLAAIAGRFDAALRNRDDALAEQQEHLLAAVQDLRRARPLYRDQKGVSREVAVESKVIRVLAELMDTLRAQGRAIDRLEAKLQASHVDGPPVTMKMVNEAVAPLLTRIDALASTVKPREALEFRENADRMNDLQSGVEALRAQLRDLPVRLAEAYRSEQAVLLEAVDHSQTLSAAAIAQGADRMETHLLQATGKLRPMERHLRILRQELRSSSEENARYARRVSDRARRHTKDAAMLKEMVSDLAKTVTALRKPTLAQRRKAGARAGAGASSPTPRIGARSKSIRERTR